MDVTDVLRDRMQTPAGLQRMVAISVLVHAVFVAAVIVGPGDWLVRRDAAPRPVMSITLGAGAPGPQTGGLTSMGGRAVQAETPPEIKRPEPVTPPAPKTPAMTIPVPGKTPVKATPTPAVKQAPDVARGRTLSKGSEVRAGSTAIETNVRGQGFGLSTSGGVGTGVRTEGNFCCPGYLDIMSRRIYQNWNSAAETASAVEIKFTIRRDGLFVGPTIQKSSGSTPLDTRALSAIMTTRQLSPLPEAYPNPELVVYLTFQYVR